ncbi:hypothetical protein B0H10DRAFT_2025326 [Mycena sp. CBHHK59/15]|nr:hypothetical protein B0H10DRAFT_2025326 [Mycena sp. CBHHK59/15]
MKSVHNTLAVVHLMALSLVKAAAFSDSSLAVSASTTSTPFNFSSTPTDSGASPSSTFNPGGPIIPAGGYVVTGIYTTCLTLTFAAPTAEPSTTTSGHHHSITASADILSSTLSSIGFSDPLSNPVSTGTPDAGATSTYTDSGDDLAVFTTCLVFLPTPTASATATGTTVVASATPTSSAPQSGSDVGGSTSVSPSASSDVTAR